MRPINLCRIILPTDAYTHANPQCPLLTTAPVDAPMSDTTHSDTTQASQELPDPAPTSAPRIPPTMSSGVHSSVDPAAASRSTQVYSALSNQVSVSSRSTIVVNDCSQPLWSTMASTGAVCSQCNRSPG